MCGWLGFNLIYEKPRSNKLPAIYAYFLKREIGNNIYKRSEFVRKSLQAQKYKLSSNITNTLAVVKNVAQLRIEFARALWNGGAHVHHLNQ